MLKYSIGLIVFILAFATGLSAHAAGVLFQALTTKDRPATKPAEDRVSPPHISITVAERDGPADFLFAENRFESNGFLIEKHIRQGIEFINEPDRPHSKAVSIEYIQVMRSGRLIGKFDANIYGGLGGIADFGFFSFLGKSSPELFISQDAPRSGCQWVVSLSPKYRVIFDGKAWNVGREVYDLAVENLDNDQVVEIIVPITDFYTFQDKMAVGSIPLPKIVFKYDSLTGKYLPANPSFKTYFMKEHVDFSQESDTNELQYRSVVLNAMTLLIYSGERDRAWDLFHHHYKLADKKEMEQRIKAILQLQPVYNFIYKNKKPTSLR